MLTNNNNILGINTAENNEKTYKNKNNIKEDKNQSQSNINLKDMETYQTL